MKYFLMSADARGEYDPPAYDTLKQMDGRVDSIKECDVVIVTQTKHPHFRFNERLAEQIASKPWVLCDWVETAWNWDQKETMLFGLNTELFFGSDYNEHWKAFDDFVRFNSPVLTFKRELLSKDASDRVKPIEYLSWLPDEGSDTKDDYGKRPLDVSYNWGRSSERRMEMHADIFRWAQKGGFDVLTEWAHVDPAIKDNPTSRKWLAVYAPHYSRIDVRDVQRYNRMSRVGIAMGGCGRKVFRTGEMCLDTLLAVEQDSLAWTYPWVPYQNCLPANAEAILNALIEPEKLYALYCAGVENGRNYEYHSYLRRHVQANIERLL